MTEANRYSILGIIAAFLAIAVFSGSNFISAAIANFNLAGLPRELRLGIDAGLISTRECGQRNLNRRISRDDFAAKLSILVEQVGVTELAGKKELESSGIFSYQPQSARISRRQAFETMARICLYFDDKGLIKLPEEKAINYRDYVIPQKYMKAAAFLQKRFVVRGYPDRSLGAGKSLSNREAVYFLYRLYETVAADMMSRQPAEGIRFVDVSLSHPIMNSIKILTRAGAFNRIMLKPAFDGEAHMKTGELAEMLEGIFAGSQRQIDQVRLKTILPPNMSLKRSQLALALEYLLGDSEEITDPATTEYRDVKIDSPEYSALQRLSAIKVKLGYQTRYFKGSEKVTWFEAVSALAATLKASAANVRAIEPVEPDRLAQKSDIQNLIALIKAKKAKVRMILETRKEYRR